MEIKNDPKNLQVKEYSSLQWKSTGVLAKSQHFQKASAHRIGGLILIFIVSMGCVVSQACGQLQDSQELEDEILQAVLEHADNVLEHDRDQWSGKDTPFLQTDLTSKRSNPQFGGTTGTSIISPTLPASRI